MEGLVNIACSTQVKVSFSFGGKSWDISTADMNLGAADNAGQLCLGGIFDLNAGSNIEAGSGNPSWVMGDVFLVRPVVTSLCNPSIF
jgi:cathepsin D